MWCLMSLLSDSGLSQLQCSLARVPCFPRIFGVDVVADDLLAKVEERVAGDSSGLKRAFEDERGWHAPWDTPPVQVLDLSVFVCVRVSLLLVSVEDRMSSSSPAS